MVARTASRLIERGLGGWSTMTGVDRTALGLFALALTLRLSYVLGLYATMGDAGLMIDDSRHYLSAAAALVGRGSPVEVGGEDLLSGQTQFMPGYIWFLALHMLAFGSTAAILAVLSQTLIDSLSCVLIAALAERVRPGLGFAAGLFAAINPTQIVLAGMILTEALFLSACTAALLAALAWFQTPRWRTALIMAAAFGLGIFTRAMLLPWAVALPLLLAVGQWRRGRLTGALIGQLGAVTALAILVQAPVLVQNWRHYDVFALTSQSGRFTLLWLAPWVRKASDGTDYAQAREELAARFAATASDIDQSNPFQVSRAMSALALSEIARLGPAAILKASAFGAAVNLFSPALILSPPIRLLPRTGFYATPGKTLVEKAGNFLFRNDNTVYGLVLLGAGLATIALRLIQLGGAVRGLGDQRSRLPVLALLAWIGFILAVNGPVASAKYRQPAEPAFAVLVALALARRPRP